MKNKKTLLALIVLAVNSSGAIASTWSSWSMSTTGDTITDASGTWNRLDFSRTKGALTQTAFFDYQGSLAADVAFTVDLPNQNAGTFASQIENSFGITVASTPNSTSTNDTGLVGIGVLSGNNAVINTFSDDFNLLGVHLGFGNIFFNFTSPITELTIRSGGQASGLSNYRAFDSIKNLGSIPPSAVPVPSAYWLFGSSLLGLIGFRKKPV